MVDECSTFPISRIRRLTFVRRWSSLWVAHSPGGLGQGWAKFIPITFKITLQER